MALNEELKGRQRTGETKPKNISICVVIISLVYIIPLSYITQITQYQGMHSIDSMTYPATSALLLVFILMGVNWLLRRFNKKALFDKAELVTAYVISMVGGFVTSMGLVGFSLGSMAGLFYHARYTHQEIYQPVFNRISSFVQVKDRAAALRFWAGTGKTEVPWGEWIWPIITWTAFWCVVFLVFLCIATMVRKRWTEIEQLTYPVTIPVLAAVGVTDNDMLSSQSNLWTNKLTYVGMIYPVVFGILALINRFVPAFPVLAGYIDLGQWFQEPPFNAFQEWYPLRFYYNQPLIIGIGYLLSLELSFSLWFTHIFAYQALKVYGVAANRPGYDNVVLVTELSRGAFLGATVLYLWLARHELKMVFQKAIFSKQANHFDDSNEPMPYAMAFWGMIVGTVLIVFFSTKVMGMDLYLAAYWWLIFFTTAFGFSRLRAEAGYPHSHTSADSPELFTIIGFGKEKVGAQNAAVMSNSFAPVKAGFIPALMGLSLDAYKFSDEVNIKRRNITWVLIIAFILAAIVGYVFALPLIYKIGFNNVEDYRKNVSTTVWYHMWIPDKIATYWRSIAVGAIIVFICGILKTRFLWWRLNGLAFGLSGSSWMGVFWGPFFLVWIIKGLIMRYGGTHLEKRLRPLFLGMVMGSVIMSIISGTINIVADLLA